MSFYEVAKAPPAAPWRELFLEHLKTMGTPEFTLCTLRRIPAGGDVPGRRPSVLTTPQYVPRARTCIFRGLWASPLTHPKNEAFRNPEGVYESDLLTFTTDVRMEKMEELWEDGLDLGLRRGRGIDSISPTTTKVGEELWEGELARLKGKKPPASDEIVRSGGGHCRRDKLNRSGGGATVEAVFWAPKPRVQWRVRGRAYVLAPDIEISYEGREVMALLKKRMRKLPPTPSPGPAFKVKNEPEWSFSREITAHFGNLSPIMRGTFRNPPPGQPISVPVEGQGLAQGQEVMDLEDPVARANFRVVVIVPDEVDQVNLMDPNRTYRWVHSYVGTPEKEWETVEVWP